MRRSSPLPTASVETRSSTSWKQLLPIDLSILLRPLLCPDPCGLLQRWLGRTIHNFDPHPKLLLCSLLAPALVASVYPWMREVWKAFASALQQQPALVLGGYLRAVDLDCKNQAFRIYEQVSLATANPSLIRSPTSLRIVIVVPTK